MPNGRSGGFPIEFADLERLASTVAGDDSVGILFSGDCAERGGHQNISGAEFVRLVGECCESHVAIEEQDHSSYIIHLSNDPLVWVFVISASPIFADLKQRHHDWETEHPDWSGWLGF